jgi:hypothetical protein
MKRCLTALSGLFGVDTLYEQSDHVLLRYATTCSLGWQICSSPEVFSPVCCWIFRKHASALRSPSAGPRSKTIAVQTISVGLWDGFFLVCDIKLVVSVRRFLEKPPWKNAVQMALSGSKSSNPVMPSIWTNAADVDSSCQIAKSEDTSDKDSGRNRHCLWSPDHYAFAGERA